MRAIGLIMRMLGMAGLILVGIHWVLRLDDDSRYERVFGDSPAMTLWGIAGLAGALVLLLLGLLLTRIRTLSRCTSTGREGESGPAPEGAGIRGRMVLIVLLALIGVGAVTLLVLRPDLPRYQGRSSLQWAESLGSPTGEVWTGARDDLRRGGEDAVLVLVKLLCDGHGEEPSRARDLLGEIAGPAVPALLEVLRNADQGDRGLAAEALGMAGTEARAAIPALADALEDEALAVRLAAARALGKMGAEGMAAVPALVNALDDEALEVRMAAAWALGEMGAEGAAAAPALVGLLRDESDDINFLPVGRERDEHRCALHSLGRIGPSAASELPVLVAYLVDVDVGADDTLRGAAAWALVQIRPEAAPHLIAAFLAPEDSIEEHLASALVGVGPLPEESPRDLAGRIREASRVARTRAAWREREPRAG